MKRLLFSLVLLPVLVRGQFAGPFVLISGGVIDPSALPNTNSITASANSNLTLTAGSGNQSLVLVPTGSGSVFFYATSGANAKIGMNGSGGQLTLSTAGGTQVDFESATRSYIKGGPLVLGTSTDSGVGVLEFVAGTSATGGITFGNDSSGGQCSIYRSGVNNITSAAANWNFVGITMGSGTGTVTAASGVFSVTSDKRAKNPHGDFVTGLAAVRQLHPVLYDFKKDKAHLERAGFYTQDIEGVIPAAVFHDSKDGMASLDDRPILAAVVNSVKELANRPSTFEIRVFEFLTLIAVFLSVMANLRHPE